MLASMRRFVSINQIMTISCEQIRSGAKDLTIRLVGKQALRDFVRFVELIEFAALSDYFVALAKL